MNESKKKIVTLTITHACNLQCSYCYEHHKTGDQMEFAIAKSIIDREIETITDEDEIEFDLFGGEPFIAFDMVKRITEYVNQKCANIPHIIFLAIWHMTSTGRATKMRKFLNENSTN